jgi:hypothetical protein
MDFPKYAQTPIFRSKIAKAIAKIKRQKIKVKANSNLVLSQENSKKGFWVTTLFHNELLAPNSFVSAAYFKKNAKLASSYCVKAV